MANKQLLRPSAVGEACQHTSERETIINPHGAVFISPFWSPTVIPHKSILNKVDSIEQIRNQKLNTIKVSWQFIQQQPLKVNEKMLYKMCKVNNQLDVKYSYQPRVSLSRNILTGEFYPEAYFICSIPEDVYTVYQTMLDRVWRFYAYDMKVEIIQENLDYKKIKLDKISGPPKMQYYEQHIYKLNDTFNVPTGEQSKKYAVLFMTKLSFKYELISAVKGKYILQYFPEDYAGIVRRKEEPVLEPEVFYLYDIINHKYNKVPRGDKISLDVEENFLKYINEFNAAQGKAVRRGFKSQYLKFEKPEITQWFQEEEAKYLKQTFEGRILLGLSPFNKSGSNAYRAIHRDEYVEQAHGSTIYLVPRIVQQIIKGVDNLEAEYVKRVKIIRAKEAQKQDKNQLIQLTGYQQWKPGKGKSEDIIALIKQREQMKKMIQELEKSSSSEETPTSYHQPPAKQIAETSITYWSTEKQTTQSILSIPCKRNINHEEGNEVLDALRETRAFGKQVVEIIESKLDSIPKLVLQVKELTQELKEIKKELNLLKEEQTYLGDEIRQMF